MSRTATAEENERIKEILTTRRSLVHTVRLNGRSMFICREEPGATPAIDELPGVHRVIGSAGPVHLAGRSLYPAGTVVRVGEVPVGGTDFTVIAGPCAVESDDQLGQSARAVVSAGAALLRG